MFLLIANHQPLRIHICTTLTVCPRDLGQTLVELTLGIKPFISGTYNLKPCAEAKCGENVTI